MKTVQIPEGAGDVGAPTLEQFAVLADQVQTLAQRVSQSDQSIEAAIADTLQFVQAFDQTLTDLAARTDALTQRIGAAETAITALQQAPAPPPPAPAPEPPPSTPPPPFAWVTGQHLAPKPVMPRPAKGVVFNDPVYDVPLVRVTDHASEPPNGFARNDYARRNPFNSDETLQLVYALDGFWHLYSADSCEYLGVALGSGIGSDCEPHWDPVRPNVLRRFANYGGDGALWETDVLTGQHTKLADIAPGFDAWTRAEGSPSADHRYWAVQCEQNWQTQEIRCYDLQEQRVVGRLTVDARPDHVSMSPCGRRVIVSYYGNGFGVRAYTSDFSSYTQIVPAYGEHSDICLLSDGTSAFVSIDYQSSAGDFFCTPLETGVRKVLFPTYPGGTALHVSGKCYDKPGWVLVSTYGSAPSKWYSDKMFMLNVETGQIRNVAFHQAGFPTQDAYFFEPHAAISRSGRRAAFTSSWGSDLQADINAYQVRLPPL